MTAPELIDSLYEQHFASGLLLHEKDREEAFMKLCKKFGYLPVPTKKRLKISGLMTESALIRFCKLHSITIIIKYGKDKDYFYIFYPDSKIGEGTIPDAPDKQEATKETDTTENEVKVEPKDSPPGDKPPWEN